MDEEQMRTVKMLEEWYRERRLRQDVSAMSVYGVPLEKMSPVALREVIWRMKEDHTRFFR